MPGYFILSHQIDDPERYMQEYVPPALGFVAKHGGELLAAGAAVDAVEGEPQSGIVVIKFPSVEAAHAFVNDSDYAPYKKLRHEITSRYQAVIVPHFEPPPA